MAEIVLIRLATLSASSRFFRLVICNPLISLVRLVVRLVQASKRIIRLVAQNPLINYELLVRLVFLRLPPIPPYVGGPTERVPPAYRLGGRRFFGATMQTRKGEPKPPNSFSAIVWCLVSPAWRVLRSIVAAVRSSLGPFLSASRQSQDGASHACQGDRQTSVPRPTGCSRTLRRIAGWSSRFLPAGRSVPSRSFNAAPAPDRGHVLAITLHCLDRLRVLAVPNSHHGIAAVADCPIDEISGFVARQAGHDLVAATVLANDCLIQPARGQNRAIIAEQLGLRHRKALAGGNWHVRHVSRVAENVAGSVVDQNVAHGFVSSGEGPGRSPAWLSQNLLNDRVCHVGILWHRDGRNPCRAGVGDFAAERSDDLGHLLNPHQAASSAARSHALDAVFSRAGHPVGRVDVIASQTQQASGVHAINPVVGAVGIFHLNSPCLPQPNAGDAIEITTCAHNDNIYVRAA